MNNYLTSQNQKRHQRALNKAVRALNKELECDELWLGRFVVRQVGSLQRRVYQDKSGVEFYAKLKFIDRATGRTYVGCHQINKWLIWNGYNIWHIMNWLITEHWNVWDELEKFERDFDTWRKYNRTERKV